MRITIRKAQSKDVDYIFQLQQTNLLQNISNENFGKGFVRVNLSKEKIETIILNNLAVVALDENLLVGYYLMSGIDEYEPATEYLRLAMEKCVYNDKLLNTYKVLTGNQACVSNEYRSLGIGKKLFIEICKLAQKKHKLLFGSITKSNNIGYSYNTSFKNSTIVWEDDERWYIVFDLDKDF
ncbi:hypothetical protein GCM10027035_18600 [Emticicia sediminis]